MENVVFEGTSAILELMRRKKDRLCVQIEEHLIFDAGNGVLSPSPFGSPWINDHKVTSWIYTTTFYHDIYLIHAIFSASALVSMTFLFSKLRRLS